MKEFGEFMLGLILIVTGIMLGGFVVQILWGWLIVPTFELRLITLPEAIGMKIFVSFLEGDQEMKEEKDGAIKGLLKAYGKLIGKCLVYLIFGYFVSLFI